MRRAPVEEVCGPRELHGGHRCNRPRNGSFVRHCARVRAWLPIARVCVTTVGHCVHGVSTRWDGMTAVRGGIARNRRLRQLWLIQCLCTVLIGQDRVNENVGVSAAHKAIAVAADEFVRSALQFTRNEAVAAAVARDATERTTTAATEATDTVIVSARTLPPTSSSQPTRTAQMVRISRELARA